MDAREIKKTPRRLMNLHNNEAGRKVKSFFLWNLRFFAVSDPDRATTKPFDSTLFERIDDIIKLNNPVRLLRNNNLI